MSVSPEVLKRIKKVAFYKYEPNVQDVLWAKPVGDGVYEFYVYYNGTWNIITEEEGVTVNISDVVGDLSTFNNDAGFVTSAEVQTALSGKQDIISNLNDIISGAQAGSTALQPNDVPSWAKQSSKPTYTASEVGALPNTTTLADLEDSTHKTVTPTEKATWNAKQDALTGYAEETFVFTLADDSTVTKTLLVK